MTDQDRARIIRCDDLLEADVNGEIVALHVEKGQCYGMNAVASRVWALLAEPTSPEQICAQLSSEFDVDAETCQTDVAALLADFESEGLIKPAA
ncbi:MAG TPA: PqqD family protein [Allosphingosinicella sp.]|jgi:hypothetical protein|uniref:PqqD family protein n=1 Tax=Allosphingosinicella sp. TaxID=2823234 RepID=UPI002F27035D